MEVGPNQLPYADRAHAGRVLAAALGAYAGGHDVLVLALPRGGVPVGYEVAQVIGAPLDVLLVRKLGLPGHEELAMGAIATGGARVLNEEVVRSVDVSAAVIEEVTAREQEELRRRLREYRGDRPEPELTGRRLILVDDGLATGSTMLAAVSAVRQQRPSEVVVAVPVAPPETCDAFEANSAIDRLVCPARPAAFGGVGRWYSDFTQTSDDEVRQLLVAARRDEPGGGSEHETRGAQ